MFESILIVCIGNICRSPIAERLFQQNYPNKNIASAGISALVDKSADPMSQNVSYQHGVDLTNHFAQQITRELCAEYDLILVMEKKHIEAVCQIAPESRGKTMLLGRWMNNIEIPDPYKQSKEAFEHVYDLISHTSAEWFQKIK